MEIPIKFLYGTESELPAGWHEIFYQMCRDIVAVLEENGLSSQNIYFSGVKEKFGYMRVYTTYHGVPAPVMYKCEEIIAEASNATAKLCCICGDTAEYISTDWILPYCGKCAASKDQSYERISF